MRILAVYILLASLAACAGYEFGDGTKAVFNFRQHYCSLPDDLKAAVHDKAQDVLSVYPEASWCDGVDFAVDVVKAI